MNKNILFGKKYCYFGKTQGVGFRPTVWKVAKLLKLNGRVYNNHECAVVELWASKEKHSNFKKLLNTKYFDNFSDKEKTNLKV